MPQVFPVSSWSEIDSVIGAAAAASREMRGWPGSRFADFLEAYALEIESRADLLVETAHAETGLAKSPRLKDGELPRTTNQIRQAAAAARSESWRVPTIDTETNNLPTRPEVEKLIGTPMWCVRGADEGDSFCNRPVAGMQVATHPGSHRASGDDATAQRVLHELGLDR